MAAMADWVAIRRALLALIDANKNRYADSKIAAQTIKDLRSTKKDFHPTVEKIEQCISLSGITLGEFFSQFESRRDHPYIPGYDDIYDAVARALRSGDSDRIEHLRSTLRYLAPEVKMPSVTAGPRRA